MVLLFAPPVIESAYVPDSNPEKGELSVVIFMPIGLAVLALGTFARWFRNKRPTGSKD